MAMFRQFRYNNEEDGGVMSQDTEVAVLRQRIAELEQMLAERDQPGTTESQFSSQHVQTDVMGIPVAWQLEEGICTFQGIPMAAMFINPTMAGLMSSFYNMVGARRFSLLMQHEGRQSVSTDWQIIASQPDFEQGFAFWSRFPILAGWGAWEIVSLDMEQKECRVCVRNSFEGRYQQTLGVCWGSGIAAGKCAGIFSKFFETNCWAEQVEFLAQGDACDSFLVRPSERSLEQEIDNLLNTNEGTRADLAVVMQKLQHELAGRKQIEQQLRIFEALVENAPDGVSVGTPEEKIIVYANRAYRAMLGYGDELLGMHGFDMLAIEEERFQTIDRQLAADGFWQGIIPCRHKDGTIILTHQSLFLITDQDNQVQALAVIARDMTEQIRHEEERVALQERIITAQRASLRELSTPLLPISDGVVAMPLMGTIDSQRAQQVMETLMEGVARYQADLAILDITGVLVVDTQVADALLRAARAVRLLGSQIILTGIQPQIAQTLVHLGVDMKDLITRSTLQAGIAYALNGRQGYE